MKLRILYRGHVSGSWVPAWSFEASTGSVLYTTRDPALAGRESARIERIEIDHIGTRVLRDRRAVTREQTERVVERADRGGWDVVWFDHVVAVLNSDVIVERGWIVVR